MCCQATAQHICNTLKAPSITFLYNYSLIHGSLFHTNISTNLIQKNQVKFTLGHLCSHDAFQMHSCFGLNFGLKRAYPRSLNISLHQIISDFARRRQSLKSKCSKIITKSEVCIEINTSINRSCLLYFASCPLSPNVKCAKRQLQSNSSKIKCAKR